MVSSKSTRALFLVSTDGRRSVLNVMWVEGGLSLNFVSRPFAYSQRLSTELSFSDMV